MRSSRCHERKFGAAVLVTGALVTSCSGSDDTAPPESAETSTSAVSTTAAPLETTTTTGTTLAADPTTTTTVAPPEPVTRNHLVVTGPEEVVFDWTTDRCEPENIPDIAARAFRDASGQTHLTIGHYVTYRMTGPSLDEVTSDCSRPILRSDYDPDPSQFNDAQWIGSPYTFDGETVYAVVHNEYRGVTHTDTRPGQCPSGENLPCLDTSFTMVVSTDGGATFEHIAEPPNHLIATLPYTYRDDTVPSGIRQPSNIIEGPDGYFYLFGNVSDQPAEEQWVCAMRTNDLADPSSWRFWDGREFAGEWKNPYIEVVDEDADKCAPLDPLSLGGSVQESVVYDEQLDRYVMVGIASNPALPETGWGVYYSLSEDLIEWTQRELLLELPVNATVGDPDNDTTHAYPAIIDPDSSSLNYSTTDGEMYLYISRFNFGGASLDRDVLRWPIAVEEYVVEPPDWTFDTTGDTEDWQAEFDLTPLDVADGELRMQSTGDDPYLVNGNMLVPADYHQLVIRMRVPDGVAETGQLFWVTDDDPEWSESKSLAFDVRGDREFRDYVFDLSEQPEWSGTIRGLRIDPLESAGRDISIDRVWFPTS